MSFMNPSEVWVIWTMMAFMHGCRLCLIRLSTPFVNMLLSESATVEGRMRNESAEGTMGLSNGSREALLSRR
jgi:hypothetical protein